MKSAFTFLLLTFSLVYNAPAQVCKPVDIAPDAQRKQLLRQYVEECRRGRYFIEGKGIISITAYQDGKGRQVWSMWAMIDDRYQDNPPRTYYKHDDLVVLVYQADSAGRTTKTALQDVAALNKCLEEIVENRVYRRPIQKDRYVDVPGPNGTTKKGLVSSLIMGNYWNSKKIIFHKDGTYKTLTGV